MIDYYLAAPFSKRDQAREIRNRIEQDLGWHCTSRWVDNHLDEGQPPDACRREANSDIVDLLEAECVVFLNLGPSEGKMFELGYAVSDDMPIYFIGEPTHIFHHLSGIKRYSSIEEFINARRGEE